MSQESRKVVEKYIKNFAKEYSNIQGQNQLFVVCGNKLAGKSLFVDFLSDKQLTRYVDNQVGVEILVQKNNTQHEYQHIHFIKNNSRIAMECFTLDQNIENNQPLIEMFKLIYLHEYLRINSRVAFFILVEDTDKQNVLLYIQRFLKCIGITQNQKHSFINVLKQFIYLVITKTQDEQTLVDMPEILQDLVNGTDNQNVKIIVENLLKQSLIIDFKNQVPTQDYIKDIRYRFVAKGYKYEQLSTILQESILRKQLSKIDLQSIDYVLNTSEQLFKYIVTMILFACTQQKIYQQQFENLASVIYPDKKRNHQIKDMIGSWNRSILSKVNIGGRIPSKNRNINIYIEIVLDLIKTLQDSSKNTKQYQQIKGRILLLRQIINFVGIKYDLDQQKNEIVLIFNKLLNLSKQSVVSKLDNKPKVSKIGGKKDNLSLFKQQIQNCKNNRQVIRKCLQKIEQRQKQQKYDYFDVIHYIKLIRDILQQFHSEKIQQKYLFINELLQISYYCNDYFDYQNYLKIALRNKLLDKYQSIKWFKQLSNNNKLNLCQKIIDYQMSQSLQSIHFNRLWKLKANLKIRMHDQYNNRQRDDPKSVIEVNKPKLRLKFEDINNKQIEGGKDVRQYFNSSSYNKHIGNNYK